MILFGSSTNNKQAVIMFGSLTNKSTNDLPTTKLILPISWFFFSKPPKLIISWIDSNGTKDFYSLQTSKY